MSAPEPSIDIRRPAAVSSAVKAMPRAGTKPRRPQPCPPPRWRSPRSTSSRVFADRCRRHRPRDRGRAGRAGRLCALLSGTCRRAIGIRAPLLRRRHRRHRAAFDVGVPGRRHLSGPGLPRPRKAIHAARLGVVGGVSARHRRVVLHQGRRSVFARLARQLLCGRSGYADRVPPRACSSWCGAGRGRAGSTAAPSWSAPTTTAMR